MALVACSFAIEPQILQKRLVQLAARHGVKAHGVVVCNGPHPLPASDHRWSFLRGSNADLDFSAYAQGSLALGPHPVVVFVNDSLFTAHHAGANLRALWGLLPLLARIELPALAGKADRYTTVCHRNPWSGLDLYISSYCFALNRSGLDVLAGLAAAADAQGLAHDTDLAAPGWGQGLDPVFREFLRANITHPCSPYRWHGLDRHLGDAPLLRRKARCIYFEHRLSGDIGRTGCILPTNAGPRARLRLYAAETAARLLRRRGSSL